MIPFEKPRDNENQNFHYFIIQIMFLKGVEEYDKNTLIDDLNNSFTTIHHTKGIRGCSSVYYLYKGNKIHIYGVMRKQGLNFSIRPTSYSSLFKIKSDIIINSTTEINYYVYTQEKFLYYLKEAYKDFMKVLDIPK